ncbi:MAG TPA: helix-turn-helix domain-containing protein [Gemmatimonadales bacterium]|jgi:AcrR family transcriptional regulator
MAASPPAQPDDDVPLRGPRRRTRQALLQAAGRLIAAGATPSVTDVADAAEISRRTAYRYFPSQDQLLVEAVLEALRPEVAAAVAASVPVASEAIDDVAQAELRLDATVRVMHRLAQQHAALLRTMIRLTTGRSDGRQPVRGYRRVDWLTSAVEPVRSRLGKARFERLVSALVSCVGMDAFFLLEDTRGLTAAAAERVALWTARALLAASVADAGGHQ